MKTKEPAKQKVVDAGKSQDSFIQDSPEVNPDYDRFRRWPFAQRIAHTIATRRNAGSIVVGIYGAWGEGKTTVLNFIEAELKRSDHIVCVTFNPWLFGNEHQLIHSFFDTLRGALGQVPLNKTKRAKIGKALQKYGSILGAVPLPGSSAVAEVAKEAGQDLTSVDLSEYKAQIEQLLGEAKRRIVVLMDDIDRLDKTEIQAVFKLVKLSADFAHTAYVLAFDDEMVAAALGEKYGSGDRAAGRNFLEKIIQVPLRLPKADALSLQDLCFEGVEEALKGAGIELTENEANTFGQRFIEGLQAGLQTPRMAKRYSNALAFGLPILKGEVNPVDLMLIEGIRILYPRLYAVMRENPAVFIGGPWSMKYRTEEESKKRDLEILSSGLEGLTKAQRDSVEELLVFLFPRLGKVLSNVLAAYSVVPGKVNEQKRVSSEEYFDRYFSYTIPVNDVSDIAVESLLKRAGSMSLNEVISEMRGLISDRNERALLSKLIQMRKLIPEESRANIALALSALGGQLPRPTVFIPSSSPFAQAAYITSQLIKDIPDSRERINVAETIISKGEPIVFAVECFESLVQEEEKADAKLTAEDKNEISKAMVNRIRELAREQLIYLKFPRDARHLLDIWQRYGSREETNKYLIESLKLDNQNAVELIKCYLPTIWSGSAKPHKGDFELDAYKGLIQVVDPGPVLNGLTSIFGAKLDDPRIMIDPHSEEKPTPEEVCARQFAEMHRRTQTLKENTTADNGGSSDDLNAKDESL